MAVPKKKIARSAGKTRYSHYQKETQKRIANETHVVYCSSCNEPKLSHCVCTACGKFKNRQVLQEKQTPETTRIQA